MITDIQELFTRIREENFVLTGRDNNLVLRSLNKNAGKKAKPDEDIINYIKENKDIIIKYLKDSDSISDQRKGSFLKKENLYPLSGLQQGMLFHGLYGGEDSTYITQMKVDVKSVDVEVLVKSWTYLLKRHTILRTSFHYKELSVPVQRVHEDVCLPFELINLSHLSPEEQETGATAFVQADAKKGFDFSVAPLMRLHLIKFSEKQHRLVWTAHHILLDGWSSSLLMGEFLMLYRRYGRGEDPVLKSEDRYADYISYIHKTDKYAEEHFWRQYLDSYTTPSLLPFTTHQKERNKGIGTYQHTDIRIDEATTTKIKNFAQQNRLTVNTLVQGVWGLLLSRYTGQDDVVYGVTVSGRPANLEGSEERVGLYINLLPLRSTIDTKSTTLEWLESIQAGHSKAREYQYGSIAELQRRYTGITGDWFDSIITFENYPVSELLKKEALLEDVSDGSIFHATGVSTKVHTNYALTITVNVSHTIHLNFSYNSNLLDAFYVEAIKNHFTQVLHEVCITQKQTPGTINILTQPEQHQLLHQFNDTVTEYPADRTIISQFETQVLKTPGAIALVYEGREMNYAELNARANLMAHHLIEKYQLAPDDQAGIMISRSDHLLVSVLAIMKTGAAYLPIDKDYPKARRSFMIEESKPKLLVVESEDLLEASGFDTPMFAVDAELDALPVVERFLQNPGRSLQPHHLAYIIYTSGSTGTPKGVMIEQGNLQNYINDAIGRYACTNAPSNFPLFTSLSFDLTQTSIFLTLLTGGKLFIYNESSTLDVLAQVLHNREINSIKLTPAHLSFFAGADYSNLQRLIIGGEKLVPADLAHINTLSPSARVYNEYGPTEATVGCTVSDISDYRHLKSIHIGRPVSNIKIYILDENLQPQPAGLVGELYIGGAQLARGYVNRQLTEERFLPNPFQPGERLYKTGDTARWLPDGNIEYMGRKDAQVKIRGYRIEPGEIENLLLSDPSIRQAVVLCHEDADSNKKLVAYVTAENFEQASTEANLRQLLPDYMIPRLWVEMESMPLTKNGKIDRKALPDPVPASTTPDKYVAPRNEAESELVEIWKELLGVEEVSIHDDFFQLGGHSLLATRLASMVRNRMKAELAIADVFEYPVLSTLCAWIVSLKKGSLLPAITPNDTKLKIPLSYSQERLWFIDKLQGTVNYHVPSILRLSGEPDRSLLEKTLKEIVSRHEILRTVIKEEEGIACQEIREASGWKLSYETVTEDTLPSRLKEISTQRFDLSADYLMRAALYQLNPNDYILAVVFHHIASDGWSNGILVKEFASIYNSFKKGERLSLPSLTLQYRDYAFWQRRYITGDYLEGQLSYWEKKLSGVPVLDLPTVRTRPAITATTGASLSFRLEKDLGDGLNALCKSEGVTLFMLLLSAFKVLLYRYTGQEDIAIGTPVANRTQQELEGMIGFFVNTLVIRSDMSGHPSFQKLLQQVKTTTLETYDHQQAPFEKVVERVVKERDMSRHPLFQVLFTLQNTPKENVELHGVDVSPYANPTGISKFDLTLTAEQGDDGIGCGISYSTALFTSERMESMALHYKELLRSITGNTHQSISELPMLTRTEEQLLLHDFNATQTSYPSNTTVIDLITRQARKTPNSIAVVFKDHQLTYKELDESSNRLAHYLRKKGVGPEVLVPICLGRSLEMITGILAILKAGGAYVPIDPEYPAERILYMLEDTGAQLVLTNKSSRDKIEGEGREVIVLDDLSTAKEPKRKPVKNITSTSLAYVIYTSGSTGTPKGVMIEHGGLYNRLAWAQDYFKLTPDDVVLQKTNYCFDVSVWELLWPLFTGAKMVLADPVLYRDTNYIKNIINKESVSFLHFVPPALDAFLPEIKAGDITTVRKVICSGEALKPATVRLFADALPSVGLYNLYGPTEASIDVSCWSLKDADWQEGMPVPIGRPVANTELYILGPGLQPQPIGVTGELCIGGIQLARGYRNRDELTREKFIANPYKAGERLYRTGDQARWLPDGNIEYIGRTDNQVKVRGYRIELGEIESLLQNEEGISQCVVLAKEDGTGNKRLVTYVVAGPHFDKDAVEERLKKNLPDYMVPRLWVQLEEMPLTSNGKADRKNLPDPLHSLTASKLYTAPRNDREEELVQIWQELLDIDRLSIHDNFFEAGGHSLLSTRLVSAIRNRMDIELAIRDVFEYPTVAAMSTYMETQKRTAAVPPVAVRNQQQKPPLSYSQERLWFIDQLQGSTAYHIPIVLRLNGEASHPVLERTLREIISRHEVLRTIICEEDGIEYQEIISAHNWSLGYQQPGEASLPAQIRSFTSQPFDLSADHMMRACLYELHQNEYILAVVFHHIASDGWSNGILVKEFASIYNSFKKGEASPLSPLALQYSDYATWQRQYITGDYLEEQLSYWDEKLSGVAILELPTDYMRPATRSMAGGHLSFRLEKELNDGLNQICKEEGVTPFMLLLTAFNVLLYRYTGQEDIAIGTPIANRTQQELEGMIGFFVNTLVIRSDMSGHPSFKNVLQQVKATTLEAYDHQQAPFEKIVERVVKERDMSRSPLFQVLFTLQNTAEENIHLDGLTLSPYAHETETAKFDLSLSASQHETGMGYTIGYRTDLFHHDTIGRMAMHYKEILRAIVAERSEAITRLPMLTPAEEHQLLHGFNDAGVAYPTDKTIIDLLEEQVHQTPGHTAITFGEQTISYRELHERSNRLAHYLRKKGIQEETLVPICTERGIDMIAGIIGILKAGGAYVPIDPSYPSHRIQYILNDTAAQLVLTSRHGKNQIGQNITTVLLDEDWPLIEKEPCITPKKNVAPNNLAYVIYTSGSTGHPKGVLVEHRSVVRLFKNEKALYDFTSQDVWTVFHSFCFDFSVWEIFGALFYGGRLVIVPETITRDVVRFSELLVSEGVTILNQTPSAFYVLQDELVTKNSSTAIRYLIFGGEALNPAKLHPWKTAYPQCDIINMYGITEITVHATYQKIEESHLSSASSIIGRPIPTLQILILDDAGNLCPVGIPGELCITGPGVARGYLNNPVLTDRKFAGNPFIPGQKMYRSGDLGRWLPDGNIEFTGRKDEQVKIRGYRIELGEIETTLLHYDESIRQVVAEAREVKGEKVLVVYFVSDTGLDKLSLRSYLQEKLPAHMVPSFYVQLASMPLTSNGKTDRKALPGIGDEDLLRHEYIAPQSSIEKELAAVWQEVLGIDRVGITDSFFDLGGSSIRAIRVTSKDKRYTIAELFSHPTIEKIARLIEEKEQSKTVTDSLLETLSKCAEPTVSIIAFPYAGGEPLIYGEEARYVKLYGEDVDFISVKYPREQFRNDSFSFAAAAEKIADEIIGTIKTPVIIQGQCIGSMLALKVAALLEEKAFPLRLLVIGSLIHSDKPGGYNTHGGSPVHSLRELGATLPDNDADMNFFLGNFLYDQGLIGREGFQQIRGEIVSGQFQKIKAPLVFITGDEDSLTETYREDFTNWLLVAEAVSLHVVPGVGHYILRDAPGEVASILLDEWERVNSE